MSQIDLISVSCALALAAIIAIGLKRRFFSTISDIPGPFLASVSSLWMIWHIIKGDNEKVLIREHEKHGVFVRISHNNVSVSDPDGVLPIMQLPKDKWYEVMALPNKHWKTPMAETDPTKCIARKKKFQAGFTPKNILISERLLDSAAEQLEGWLDKLAKAREAVEIGRWINYTAFDILGLVVFSEPFGFLAEGRDINGSIANARQLEVYIPVVGYFQWIHDMTVGNPIIDNWNLTPSHHIFDTARRAIKTSKEKPITGYDMMGRWLRWQQDNPDVHYEKTEIEAMAASVLSAGADTISATLQSLLYHLIRSPKHLERLRQEIDIAQSQTNPSKALSYDETQKLPFLRACVQEAYRVHPGVSFPLPRVVQKNGFTVGDRHFVEGVSLCIHPWVIHQSKRVFGSDAKDFNPTRWLEPGAKNMHKYLVHWGKGYNICPGQHLADIVISKLTATLIRDYDFELANPDQPWVITSWFMASPEPWYVKLQRREATKS